jgi:hypothetical protein
MANPSHLEAVDTCVLGKTRAKQLLSVRARGLGGFGAQGVWGSGLGVQSRGFRVLLVSVRPAGAAPPLPCPLAPNCAAFTRLPPPPPPSPASIPLLRLHPATQNDADRSKHMGILLHGDGAFSGQARRFSPPF